MSPVCKHGPWSYLGTILSPALVHCGGWEVPGSRHDRRGCRGCTPGTQYTSRSTADPRASRNCPLGPARLLAPLPGRCHPWILASLHVLWLHEPTPYAPQTSHFVRVCLPVIQTSLRSANTTSYLTGKRSWRHQDHVCPLLCASGDPSRWSHGRFSARSLDVRWAEGCCAGSRPCHLEWGAISQARACSALPEEPRRASRFC